MKAGHPFPMIVPSMPGELGFSGRRGVAVLGSTGSIGRQTLAVIDRHPDRFHVVSLAAGSVSDLLRQQIARYRPAVVAAESLDRGATPGGVPMLAGIDGLTA